MGEIGHTAYRFASLLLASVRPSAHFLIIMFAVPNVLWADCPTPRSVRQEYEHATLVFVADVISMRPAPRATGSGVIGYIRFKVLERLKGAITNTADLAFDSGSEEAYLAVGQRVLVYASRRGDAWSTACTRTKEISSSESEAATVRALRDRRARGVEGAAESGSIAGRVADPSGAALPGVTVTTIPEAGGTARQTETGPGGAYRLAGLADGTYRVDFELPGFDLARRNHVHVTAESPARADGTLYVRPICDCIVVLPNEGLRERAGQVFGGSGQPLPHARLHIGTPWSEVAYADSEGRFVVRVPMNGTSPLTASDSGFLPNTQQVSGSVYAPIVFRLARARAEEVPDSEQFKRGCRCEGRLFTHDGR